jgi:hypothetical protein
MNDDAEKNAKLALLRAAIDDGIAELEADLGLETTPEELLADVLVELGLDE